MSFLLKLVIYLHIFVMNYTFVYILSNVISNNKMKIIMKYKYFVFLVC